MSQEHVEIVAVPAKLASRKRSAPVLKVVFRTPRRCRNECARSGELLLRPTAAYESYAALMAHLVLEHGLEGLMQGPGPLEQATVTDSPTFDDMLALLFVEELRAGGRLLGGAAALANAAAKLRRGVRPWPEDLPIPDAIDAVFATMRANAGKDLTNSASRRQFLADWERLAGALRPILRRRGAPDWSKVLSAGDFDGERQYIREDEKCYQRYRDDGDRGMIRLPGVPAPVPGLLLFDPSKSALFDVWSRSDRSAPQGQGYRFLAVCWGEGKWDFSTHPVHQNEIGSLAKQLQTAEKRRFPDADDDPWYDGKRHGHTMVSAPWRGTCLSDEEVLEIVRAWGQAEPAPVGDVVPPPPIPAALPLPGGSWKLFRNVGIAAVVVAVLGGVALYLGTLREPDALAFPSRLIEEAQRQDIRGDGEDVGGDDSKSVTLGPTSPGTLEFHLANPTGRDIPIRLQLFFPLRKELPFRTAEVVFPGYRPAVLPIVWLGDPRTRSLASELHRFTLPSGGANIQVRLHSSQKLSDLLVGLHWKRNNNALSLHVLTVGVGRYPKASELPRLEAPARDARDLTAAFRDLQGRLFDRVEVCDRTPLIDGAATREGIVNRLGDFVKQVQADDTRWKLAVVLLAGHGVSVDNRWFVFKPHNYRDNQPGTHLYWEALVPHLEQLGCPVLVVLDSCDSGQAGRPRGQEADLQEYLKDFPRKAGIVVLAAAQPKQPAREGKHGWLTQAILEVLDGSATVEGPGWVVTLEQLSIYARKRVKAIAKKNGVLQLPLLRPDPHIRPENIPIALRSRKSE